MDMKIHARATTARPSLAYSAECAGFRKLSRPPMTASSAMGIRKGTGDSPYPRPTAMGSRSSAASTRRIRPMTNPMIR